jgi:hypothetical protein
MRTVTAMSKAGQYQKVMENPGLKSTLRRKGPFLPDGREICRKFNSGSCEFQRCRMVHNCAICSRSQSSRAQCKKRSEKTTTEFDSLEFLRNISCVNTYRLNVNSWSNLLPSDDIDYDFLLSGVKNGFSIVDHMPQFNSSVLCDNYRSALSNKRLVEKQIKI